MKRILAVLLACAAVLSAASCSSGSSSASESKADTTTAESQTENDPETESEAEPEPEPLVLDDTPLVVPELEIPDLETVKAEYAAAEKERAELYEKLSKEYDHPVINITTEGGKKIKKKDEYSAAVIDLFNCDEQYKLSAAGGVKVRGNSTADQGREKPYRIKFEEKHNMLGLHDGEEYKSWVLLKSNWNLVPDYMAFNLAKKIFGGEYYSSDVEYVNVYVNGKYMDLYILCEQNQAQRLGLVEPEEGTNEADIGYFVEMDNYPGEDHPFFTLEYSTEPIKDIDGESRIPVSAEYSVKSKINTQGQLDFIEKYIKGVWQIVYEGVINNKPMMFDGQYNVVPADGTYTVQQACEAVLDTKSVANMLILEELVHNYDVGEGSFYFAVDFSEGSKYNKLTMQAPWDFNWAYEGNGWGQWYASTWQPEVGSQDRSNPWFVVLMKADWFRASVEQVWKDIGAPDSLNAVNEAVAAKAEEMRHDLGEEQSWRSDCGLDIVKFVKQRILWLDKQFTEKA